MDITTKKLFDGTSIAASASLTSVAVSVQGYGKDGLASLYIYETGDGTGQWTYLLSADGDDYIEFIDAADMISAGFLKTSGPNSDGKDIIQFSPELAPFIKIKCEEVGTADAVTPVAILMIQ